MDWHDLEVVVVDDDANRDFVARCVQQLGCSTTACSSGKEAQRHLEQHHIDLVLTDLIMPELDGIALLRYIRQNHPQTDVIVISAQDDEVAITETMRRGALAYLLKPITETALIETLEHYRKRKHNSSNPD